MMHEVELQLPDDLPQVSTISERCARIDGILDILAAPIAQIDSSFVAAGEELLGCASMLSKVSSTFEALPKDFESPELLEGTQKLSGVIAHAAEISKSFGAEQADLDALMSRLNAARAPMATLRQIIQMIGILAINARVVAASVAAGDDEVSVFTTDIADLSKSATSTILGFFKAYEDLSKDLQKVAAGRARFQAVQQTALQQAGRRLSDNLDQVTQRRERSAQNGTTVSQVTRDIGARVGATVVSMQVGDSTRQRIEHVVSGLKDLQSLIAAETVDGRDVPDALREHGLATVLLLQDRQLDAARADYEGDIASAEQSMAALSANAGQIMSLSRDLYGQEDHRGESAIGALSADMREVSAIFEACDIDRHKLDAAAATVGEMVNQLLSHVEDVQTIEGSMRLVTLNAAVKCAQLGPRGKALDVIAKQLRELTADTVASAKDALSLLNEVADRARSLADSVNGEASASIKQLLEEATTTIGLFEQVDHRQSEALQLLDELAASSSEKLAVAERRFAGHSAISEQIQDAHIQVLALMDEVGGADIKAVLAEELGVQLLDRMRKNYTMESERLIHDQAVGSTEAVPSAGVSESFEDDEDLGLF